MVTWALYKGTAQCQLTQRGTFDHVCSSAILECMKMHENIMKAKQTVAAPESQFRTASRSEWPDSSGEKGERRGKVDKHPRAAKSLIKDLIC